MDGWRLVGMGLAAVLVAGACSSSHRTNQAASSTSSPSTTGVSNSPASRPHRAFADALAAGDKQAMNDIFAPDAQFFTPVLAQPIVGHDHVVKLVGVLIDTFQDRHAVA